MRISDWSSTCALPISDSASTTADKLAAQLRDINNAGIQTRNAQYKQINAQVESDQTYFQNRIATATSVDELLSDNRFLKVIAYANGYGDTYTTNPQHLRDILTSDLNDPNSVARQGSVQDLELAKKYNFGARSEEHKSELQSLMRISYSV